MFLEKNMYLLSVTSFDLHVQSQSGLSLKYDSPEALIFTPVANLLKGVEMGESYQL